MRDLRGRVLVLAMLILAAWGAPPARAQSCLPPPPTPWFVETVTITPPDLPEGVAMRAEGRGVVFTNTTQSDLYMLGRPRPALKPYRTLGLELPQGLVPAYRLTASRSFEWRGARSRWVALGPGPALRIVLGFVPPAEDRLQLFTHDLWSANQVGDGRPDDVALPAPQQSLLHLVYGQQVIAVPFTLSYALNPSYDPRSVARGEELCNPRQPLLRLFLLVAGVIVLAILAIMASYSRGLRPRR